MEYITPLIYRKILDTITYIYNKSTNEEDYDLFRFKDVLDSFSEGQLFNKNWAVEELNKLINENYEECLVIGSWYGLFSHLLAESGFKGKIINIELDPVCNNIAKRLKVHSNIIFKHADGMEIFDELNYGNKILVCTACEHIDDEELSFSQSEIGIVKQLPLEPYIIESETKARVAEVEFENNERKLVPRANLEIILD